MVEDNTAHRAMIRSLCEKLRACYVFPDIAEQLCTCLQNHLENGDYADVDDELLALALTMHLQEVNRDEHLWVRWHTEPLPEEESSLRHNLAWQDECMLAARLDNYGFHKIERLPGNIGHIEIRYFHRPAWSGNIVAAAMTCMANMDAMIIDLRRCTGGYPGMVALLTSYFFGEEPVHLSSIYWRDDDFTQQYWTLPYVPGKRFDVKPVYVLTSRVTFSAGEEFASILQSRGRATIIGDKTDGGAHPGTSYRLSPHFEVFIPIGLTTNPITGTDLEGVGVIPDISIPQEQAFTAAYYMALRSSLASLGEPSSRSLRELVEEIRSALREVEVNRKMCVKCGYPNSISNITCKNCDEQLA